MKNKWSSFLGIAPLPTSPILSWLPTHTNTRTYDECVCVWGITVVFFSQPMNIFVCLGDIALYTLTFLLLLLLLLTWPVFFMEGRTRRSKKSWPELNNKLISVEYTQKHWRNHNLSGPKTETETETETENENENYRKKKNQNQTENGKIQKKKKKIGHGIMVVCYRFKCVC